MNGFVVEPRHALHHEDGSDRVGSHLEAQVDPSRIAVDEAAPVEARIAPTVPKETR